MLNSSEVMSIQTSSFVLYLSEKITNIVILCFPTFGFFDSFSLCVIVGSQDNQDSK